MRAFAPDILAIGQSLADFTAIILERAREADLSRRVTTQLELALTARVIIEQAKGILANRRAVSMEEAFDLLRAGRARGAWPRLLGLPASAALVRLVRPFTGQIQLPLQRTRCSVGGGMNTDSTWQFACFSTTPK
jgi:hypothetical protein